MLFLPPHTTTTTSQSVLEMTSSSVVSPATPSSPDKQAKQAQVLHAALAPAALWCSPKSASSFIMEASSCSGGGVSSPALLLPLAPAENVSLQVPTSPQATAIFWEFATECNDIGFGLSFEEWSSKEQSPSPMKHQEQLLPLTVRGYCEDLVLGSHQYQHQGTYTLTFINTNPTLPRTVYYKVFYQTTTY